jgi:hypothetical protein
LNPFIFVGYFVLGGYLAAVERPLPQSPPAASARRPKNTKITNNTKENNEKYKNTKMNISMQKLYLLFVFFVILVARPS